VRLFSLKKRAAVSALSRGEISSRSGFSARS
jgi:hypothetical protein